tara:strand:- start:429 stop:575 length:147 start_codon:yes stop_codon:yes gene_type:complete
MMSPVNVCLDRRYLFVEADCCQIIYAKWLMKEMKKQTEITINSFKTYI